MIKHHGGDGHRPPYPPPGGPTNLASCIVATLFLVFLVILAFIVYFTLFNPKDPRIAVNAVQLPSFTAANGTASFTFSQYVAVKNPNRAVFSHYESTLRLLYAGNQIGFMFIPAGKIAAGKTEYMAATFVVKSIPVSPEPENVAGIAGFSPAMEIESRMEVGGRVRMLHFFTHHVAATADCRVAIGVSDGSLLGFHC